MDFEASSLPVAQLRLNADSGALDARCGGIARHWRGALSAAITSAKRTELQWSIVTLERKSAKYSSNVL